MVVTNPDGAAGQLDGGFTYADSDAAKLDLLSLKPAKAKSDGGSVILVDGKGMQTGAMIFVDWEPREGLDVQDAEHAIFTTPKLPKGTWDVAMSNPDGQSDTLPKGIEVVNVADLKDPAPKIDAVSPALASAQGGTVVKISGSGLVSGSQLLLGLEQVDSWKVDSADTGTFTAAAHDPGALSVIITNPDGQSYTWGKKFFYFLDLPTIYGVDPAQGVLAGGETVTIKGALFADGMTVQLGEGECTGLKVVDANNATCTTPPGKAPGFVGVKVLLASGLFGFLPDAFEYLGKAPDPKIKKVVPNSGPIEGGIVVAVEGEFFQKESTVWFGDKKVDSVYGTSPGHIAVQLPAGKAGKVDVTVKTEGFPDAVFTAGFTYTEQGPPEITEVVPASGPTTGGVIVLVKGKNLRPESKVLFGDQAAQTSYVTGPEAIGVLLPKGVEGVVDVTIKTDGHPDTVLKKGFTYLEGKEDKGASMALAQILPNSGPTTGGTWVILKGVLLPLGGKVFFGGKPAKDVVSISSEVMTARVPKGTKAGAVEVTVQDPQTLKTAALPGGFKYWDPKDAKQPAPKLTAIKPAIGPSQGNTLALLEGQGLLAGGFAFVGGRPGDKLLVVGDQQATFRTPPGKPGPASVVFVNPDGQFGELPAGFVFTSGGTSSITLSGVLPVQGTAAGGTGVLVSGKGFSPGAQVFLDGLPVSSLLKGPTSITFTTPKHTPGLVDVQVTAPDGWTAELADAFNFILESPFVAGASPSWGPPAGGTEVLVTGQGFHPKATVTFGDQKATVLAAQPGQLKVKTPPAKDGKSGKVDITVANPDFLSHTMTGGFEYSVTAPGQSVAISQVAPDVGPATGGTEVVISGVGFVKDVSVIVGTKIAPKVVVVDENTLQVTMPAGTVGAQAVKVVVAGVGSATRQAGFFYFDAKAPGPFPKLLAVVPGVGPTSGGTVARLWVTPAEADAKVFFGGLPAKLLGADGANALVVQTPAHGAGPVRVSVMLANGKAHTVLGAFSYYVAKAGTKPPVLTQILPTNGSAAGGEPVKLSGTDLVKGTLAFIGYRPMTDVKVPADTTLTGDAPAHPAGLVDVAVTRPDGFSAVLKAAFGYKAPAPVPTMIFPTVGHKDGGLTAVVSGKHFLKGAQVFFDKVQSKKVVVAGPGVLSAQVPPTAKVGKVTIEVLNPDGKKGALAQAFTYISGQFAFPPPKVTSVMPPHGPFSGGTVAAIWGSGFRVGAQVLFGGVPATVHVVDENMISVTSPPGFIGPVDVTVLNPDGQGHALGSGFTYKTPTLPKPMLLGITPSSGPESGSTAVIFSGSHIVGGGIGFVGYRPVSSWTVLNSAIATGTTAPGVKAGKTDVVATNGDGQSATLKDAWIYVGAPKIEGFNPSMGGVAGGTVVHIAGKNFAQGAKVEIAGKKVAATSVLSAFVIKIQTAPGTAGPSSLKVTNPDGQSVVAKMPWLYTLPPQITEIFPAKGIATGNAPVIIRGKHFLKGVKVLFGKVPATKVNYVSPTALTVRTPGGKPGEVVAVSIENPDTQSAFANKAYTYLDPKDITPPPKIEKVSPPTGPSSGGTWGLITAKQMAPGAQAIFGIVPSAAFNVAEGGVARFVTGPSPVTAVVDVIVLNPDGGHGVKAKGFKYTDLATLGPAPKIASIDPNEGPTKGGHKAVIIGNGMSSQAWAFFDTSPAVSTKVVDNGASAITPKHALGAVNVSVTNQAGRTTTAKGAYTYVPPPKINKVDPGAGPAAGGTFLTITGKYFKVAKDGGKAAKVVFCTSFEMSSNCVTALEKTTKVVSSTKIEVTTPLQVPGMNDVVVINPDGQADYLGKGFLFRPPPKIQNINPDKGSTLGGTNVKLVGVGFQKGIEVMFGKAKATEVNVVDGSNVLCKTPKGTEGPVMVSVKNPDLSTHSVGGGFTYLAPPKVASVFPTLGPVSGGTKVTIQGSGFVTGVLGSQVWFGPKKVEQAKMKVENNGLITAVSPKGSGPVAIKVVNPDGQFDAKAGGFVYIPVVPPPKVTYIQPDFGPTGGGYLTNVIGTGFLQGAQVAFGNDATKWSNAAAVKVLNAGTLIVATVPAHVAGKVDVKVTNSDGQSGIKTKSFEFTAPQGLPGLAFSGVVPTRGPASGGYEVVIYGQGFKTGVKVYWGSSGDSKWTNSTNVLRLGPTILKVKVPDYGKNGPVDIRIVNPAFGGKADEVVAKAKFHFGQAVVLEPKGHRLPIDYSRGDYEPVIFDANGDGLKDVLILHDHDYDDLFINTKDSNGVAGKFVDQSKTNMPKNHGYCRYRRNPLVWDLDKDGDLDVVFKGSNRYLCWYKNKGNGVFTNHPIGYFYKGGYDYNTSSDAARGDLNCDGIDDIFVVTTQRNFILQGNGKGGFTMITNVMPNHSEPSRGVAVGDVDNDGDNDVLVANDNAYQNRLYYNNCNNISKGKPWSFTDATYGTGKNFPVSGFNSKQALLKDINGDGWLDAMILNWGQADRLYFNKTGNFLNDDGLHLPQNEKKPHSAQGWLIDVDIDGDLDLIIKKYMSGDRYWPAVYLNDKAQGGASVFTDATPTNIPPHMGEISYYMGLGDLNGDGLPDIYISKRDDQDWLLLNKGWKENAAMTEKNRVPTGAFANNTMFGLPEDAYDTHSCDAGDIDGDGDIDLVMNATWGAWTRIWVNDGAGNFFDETKARIKDTKCHTGDIKLIDLNGDKDLDLALACYYWHSKYTPNGGGLRQFVNNGKGYFTDRSSPNLPETYNGARYHSLQAADVDGDGDLDLAVMGQGWTWRFMVNGGDPFNNGGAFFFTKNDWLNPGTGHNKNHLVFIDLNNDKHLDAYIGLNTQNQLWYNTGTGKMKNVSYSHLPSISDDTRRVLATDVDFDGDVDLFVINNGQNRLHVGELDYKFADVTASHLPGMGGNSTGGAVVDLDMDGYMDFVWTNYDGQNMLMLNQGEAKFGNFTSSMPRDYDGSRCMAVADFDGDGRQDIFIGNRNANRIYLNKTPKPKKKAGGN